MAGKHWIQRLHKGGLHKALGVDPNKPIPKEKMAEARKSENPRIRKMAATAATLSKLRP